MLIELVFKLIFMSFNANLVPVDGTGISNTEENTRICLLELKAALPASFQCDRMSATGNAVRKP